MSKAMTALDYLTEFPDDPTYMFVKLYDRFGNAPFRDGRAFQWAADLEVRHQADRIEEHVLETGAADPATVSKIVPVVDDKSIFTVLRGIDGALEYVNPFGPVLDHGKLAWVAGRYAETGIYNDRPLDLGALLPRGGFPARVRSDRDKTSWFGSTASRPGCGTRGSSTPSAAPAFSRHSSLGRS